MVRAGDSKISDGFESGSTLLGLVTPTACSTCGLANDSPGAPEVGGTSLPLLHCSSITPREVVPEMKMTRASCRIQVTINTIMGGANEVVQW